MDGRVWISFSPQRHGDFIILPPSTPSFFEGTDDIIRRVKTGSYETDEYLTVWCSVWTFARGLSVVCSALLNSYRTISVYDPVNSSSDLVLDASSNISICIRSMSYISTDSTSNLSSNFASHRIVTGPLYPPNIEYSFETSSPT